MPDIFPVETTVGWDWATSGGSPPEFERNLGATVSWGFETTGSPVRELIMTPAPANWSWGVDTSADELAREELFVGTGVKLSVYELANPEERLAIVQYEELSFEDGLSGIYGGKATIGTKYFDPSWLDMEMIWRVDVEGIERGAFITQDAEEFKVSKDGKRITVTGRSPGCLLEWATIAPDQFGGSGESVVRRFTAPRPRILYDLLGEAHARGTIPFVEATDWDGTRGADGFVWNTFPELEFRAGGNMAELTNSWTDLGFEWHMDSRFNWRVAASFGRDLSSLVRLYPVQSLEEQIVTKSFKDLRNAFFVQDGNDGVSYIQDAASIASYMKREQYVVFGDTVTEGDRTANGYALMHLLKNPVTERIIKIDPYAVGRRPWVDFTIGDTVGAMFGGTAYPFRVLAISIISQKGKYPRCEVVLEDMIEASRRRRRRLLGDSGGGGGVSTGQSTVFAENNAPITLGTAPNDICGLTLTSFISTHGKLGWLLNGTASAPQLITVEVVYNGTIIKTFYHQVPRAGLDTAEITWLWPAIPSGEVPLILRVRTDTGTFALAAPGDAQLWVEAKGIQGILTNDLEINVSDDVRGGKTLATDLYPASGITETVSFSDLETDYRPEIVDYPVLDLYSVVDSLLDPPLSWGIPMEVSIANNDGQISGASTFTSAGTTTTAGDIAGVSYSAFYRFVMPAIDLTGCTITEAWLTGVADTTQAIAATTQLKAALSANPATVANYADYNSRTKTTNSIGWNGTSTAGVSINSPDLRSIIQELVDTYGNLSSILFFQANNSSLANGRFVFRSEEHASSAAMRLTIRYTTP